VLAAILIPQSVVDEPRRSAGLARCVIQACGYNLEPVEYPEENALNIYTDGSMLSSPRRGGAAILVVVIDDQGNEEQREKS